MKRVAETRAELERAGWARVDDVPSTGPASSAVVSACRMAGVPLREPRDAWGQRYAPAWAVRLLFEWPADAGGPNDSLLGRVVRALYTMNRGDAADAVLAAYKLAGRSAVQAVIDQIMEAP